MEWLTTGQMIDKLRVGEVAESDGYWEVKKLENGAIVELNNGQGVMLNVGFMENKWRILPNFVSFGEAMEALEDGETVRCYPVDDSYIEFCEADSLHSVASQWSCISFSTLINSKWTIQEDNQ